MKINVSEATPLQLDWLVAKCEGLNPNTDPKLRKQYVGYSGFAEGNGFGYAIKHYSTDWSQGGPIIEREFISLDPFDDHPRWCATIPCYPYNQHGHTPLVAAMRSYVASKLGDEVEVPDELI